MKSVKAKRFFAALLVTAIILSGCSESTPGSDITTTSAAETAAPETSEAETTAAEEPSETEITAAKESPPLSKDDIEISISSAGCITLETTGFELHYKYSGRAGYAEYMFGCYYKLEKLENGRWREVPFSENALFNDLGYFIGTEYPENSTEVSLSPDFYAEPLTEGRYRVAKDIEDLTFYVEFEILAGAPAETAVETTTAAKTSPAAETTEAAAAATTPPETTTAPPETTTSAPDKEPAADQPQPLLMTTYDNYAWGYQQSIIILADDGKYYSFSTEEMEDGVKYREGDWFAELSEKVLSGEGRKYDEETLSKLSEFAAKLPEYEKLPMKEDESLGMCDYGNKSLYAFYNDGSGKPHMVKLAGFGDNGAGCLDSPEVRSFVNGLIEDGYFSMTGCVFGEDGNVRELYELDSEDGYLTLVITDINDGYFTCMHPWPYPAVYCVMADPSEYPDYCVGDKIDVEYSTMYRRYDDEFYLIVYPLYIGPSDYMTPTSNGDENVVYKPVIYLYPEEKTDVSVRLDFNGGLTVTYPDYKNGWNVTAMPDGTLYDADGNEYSYLFWEGETDVRYDFSSGFCVRGCDTAAFLREKLAFLGLTPREYNEFIVFWLPLMQNNEYNIISFQFDRYTDNAVLSVTPEPDTVLRVFMAFYASDVPVDIPEQELRHTEREGFTVVEWGGCGARTGLSAFNG